MIDLNTLIDPASGWILTSARDINDAGQITGTGLFDGQPRAFLLTPVPEPSSVLLAALAAAIVGGRMCLTARGRARDRRVR